MLALLLAVLGGTVGVGWNTDAFEPARNMAALWWFGETNSATVELEPLEPDETPEVVAAESPKPAPTPYSSPLPATGAPGPSPTPVPPSLPALVPPALVPPALVPPALVPPALVPPALVPPTPQPTPTPTPRILLPDTQNARWLKRTYPVLAQRVANFPWIADGLSETERRTVDELLYLAANDLDTMRSVIELPWVRDSGGVLVRGAVRQLSNIAYDNPSASRSIANQPFLRTLESGDVLALRAASTLLAKGVLDNLTDHPAFQDGITDAETVRVAAAGTLYRAPDEIERVLNPDEYHVETLVTPTPFTPNLRISIFRSGTQSRPGTAKAIRDAVAFTEDVMQKPLPSNHVIVVLNDDAVRPGAAGTNYGFAVSYSPDYEKPVGTWEQRELQAGMVHEVAHYFWSGNEGWMDEGLANTFEVMYGMDQGLSRGQLRTHRKDCEAHDLAMLSEWDPDASSSRYLCNYYLGQGLFQELRESLGDEGFGKRLRKLYQLSLTEQESDWIPGIADVRQVFSEQAAIIDRHWSGKLNAPDNLPYDAGIDLTSHDLIQWDQYPTYDRRSVTFKGTLIDEAILENNRPDLGGMQNFALFSVDELKYPGNILSPRIDGAGWDSSNTGSVVANTYWIYQADGTFHVEFSFPTVLGNPSDYAITVWGFQDASQTPTISEDADLLGYARIRIP